MSRAEPESVGAHRDKRRGVIHVVVFSPLGRGGRGGIDRMMDAVAEETARSPPPGIDIRFLTARGGGSILLSPLHMAKAILLLVVFVIRRRVDVVHINLSSYGSTYRKIIVAQVVRMLGKPYAIHLHSGKFPEFWGSAPSWLGRQITDLFARASAVIVLGSIWASFMRKRMGSALPPLFVLPNASKRPEEREKRPAGGVPHILFLGAITGSKGAYDLLAALDGMLQRGVPFRATVAGNGEVEEFRKAVERRGLEKQIAVPGWVGPDEVDGLLREADILTLPSYWENLPMVVVEAFAHGLAVVATPVGAISELIDDGKTGMLVPVGNSLALTDALARLVEDVNLRRRLGAGARRVFLERLTIEDYVRRLTEVWRSVATGS